MFYVLFINAHVLKWGVSSNHKQPTLSVYYICPSLYGGKQDRIARDQNGGCINPS